ncbi:MAG: MalM family protein [Steroidobacteraceae bacterium]
MLLLSLVFAAVLAGCATAPAQSYPAKPEARLALYARTKACCDDPSTFSYEPLPEQGSADVDINRATLAFEFQSGLSPFAAFKLPKVTTPYDLRVKSFFDAGHSGGASIFYPVVALLDDTFIVLRMSGLDNLRLEPALTTAGGETGLAVTVPIDPASEDARYLVVFTPAAVLGAAPDSRREGDLLTPSSLAWLERRGNATVAASPYGRLRITVAPELPADESAGGQ